MPTIGPGITLGAGVTVTAGTVVVDNLQLYLDAGVSTSYGGTGTTWTDISGKNRNYTWTTTPSFTSSGSASYFSTLGKTASGPLATLFEVSNTGNYAVVIVCLQNTQTTNIAFYWPGTGADPRGIQSHLAWSDGVVYWDQGGCCFSDTRTSVASGGTNTWNMWTYNRSSSTNRQIWKNTTSLTTNTSAAASLGLSANAALINQISGAVDWDARLAAVLLYNNSLTTDHITQNYNYFRARYGIA